MRTAKYANCSLYQHPTRALHNPLKVLARSMKEKTSFRALHTQNQITLKFIQDIHVCMSVVVRCMPFQTLVFKMYVDPKVARTHRGVQVIPELPCLRLVSQGPFMDLRCKVNPMLIVQNHSLQEAHTSEQELECEVGWSSKKTLP